MDFGQVEAFALVASHKSFSRAAEVLQVTQPSVTARIQSLERDLGEELFERAGRSVRLTDAGSAFLYYADRILRDAREGRAAVDEVSHTRLGSLKVGSAFTISIYILPHILRLFREEFSGIDVSVRTGHSEQVLAMVLNGDVQVGLARTLSHPDVESVHLYDDQIGVIVGAGHPLAGVGSATCEEVADYPVILFSRGSSYHGLIQNFFRQAGVMPNVAMELDSLEAIKRMVEEGLGIALVPRVTVKREILSRAVTEVKISDAPAISRPISLIYNRTRKPSRVVQAFVTVVCRNYRVSAPAVGP